MKFDNQYMLKSLELAKAAILVDEVPVGAIVVKDGEIISSAHNTTISSCDPTAHAEINVIREACRKLQTHRLDGCDIYITLEPCPMCAQAISNARIKRLYFGASDQKGGGVLHGAKVFNHNAAFHKPEVYDGILEADCASVLSEFFRTKRQ